MKPKKPFKILVLILAFSLTGGMVPKAFADCGSPCCGSKGCHVNPEPTLPDVCDLFDLFIEKFRSTSCNIHKASSVEGTQGVRLTASRAELPAPGVHVVLSDELSPLSNYFEGPCRKADNLARAAPEPLYLKNLTLLI